MTANDSAELLAKSCWNAEADSYNQWTELGEDEQTELIAAVLAETKESK